MHTMTNIPEKIQSTNQSYLSSEGCLALYQTNTRMSGNHKLVYQDDNHLFIESISSNEYLSNSAFKKHAVDMSQGYLHNLRTFFKNIASVDSIWAVKQIIATKAEQFSEQYDNTYKWGAYNEQNDFITKKRRFFAPLFVYNKLPDRFVIFRVPSTLSGATIKDYIKYGKLVSYVDMRESTKFGTYLRTLTNNSEFKEYCFYANFDDNCIRYAGMDINSGKLIEATEYSIESYLANERTIVEFDNELTNGWKRNKIICPNILNLEFVLEDDASDGMNSYIGFYCFDNEISDYEAQYLSYNTSGCVIVASDDTQNIIFKQTSENKFNFLEKYHTTVANITLQTQTSSSFPPLIELSLKNIPRLGSRFDITFNDDAIFTLYFSREVIELPTSKDILQYIADAINEKYFSTISLYASVINDHLFIKSNVNSIEFEKLKVVSSYFEFHNNINSIASDDVSTNNFRSISPTDIIANNVTQLDKDIDRVVIDGKSFEIQETFTYNSAFIIRLDDSFRYHSIVNHVAQLQKEVYPTYNLLSFAKFVMFDMFMITEEDKYKLLGEDVMEETNITNVCVPLVCKFANVNGNNSNIEPIRLQISRAYKQYNNQPAETLSISKERNSLSWFLLEEQEVAYNDLSYAKHGFVDALYSTVVDAYDLLIRNVSENDYLYSSTEITEYTSINQWSELKKVPGNDSLYMTIFKGLEWRIPGNFEGYRFCVVATSQTNNDLFKLVNNETFKTLTLVIHLSNANLTNDSIYDGTLFETTNKTDNISSLTSVSFDIFNISNKQDTTGNTKRLKIKYKNAYKYHWWSIRNNKPVFRIGYDARSTIYTLKDIVKNDTCSWYYVSTTPEVFVVLKFTAVGIYEVEDDHMWCEDIRMEFLPEAAELESFSPYHTTQTFTFDDILKSPTKEVEIDGVKFVLPFWEKIKECGKNGYVSLKDQYYEESGDFEYVDDISSVEGNCPNGVSFVKKDAVSGMLFDHDQFWFICQQFSKNAKTQYVSMIDMYKLNASYVSQFLNNNNIPYCSVNGNSHIDTYTNISCLLTDKTYIITSLEFDDTELKRVDKQYSIIFRQTGYYAPLFRDIFAPKTITFPPALRQYSTMSKFIDDIEYDETKRRYYQYLWFADGSENNDSIINNQYNIFRQFAIGEPMKDYNLVKVSTSDLSLHEVSVLDITESPDDIKNKRVGQLVQVEKESGKYELRTWKDSNFDELILVTNDDVTFKHSFLPDYNIPQYTGRKICSNSYIQQFWELWSNPFMLNPSCDKIYLTYANSSYTKVITQIVNSIQRGFISSAISFIDKLDVNIMFSSKIDIPYILKYIIGTSILKDWEDISDKNMYTDAYYALQLYDKSVTKENIIYKDIYEEFFRLFYKEVFSKFWKISSVKTVGGTKLDFSQLNTDELTILQSDVYGSPIKELIITFTRI